MSRSRNGRDKDIRIVVKPSSRLSYSIKALVKMTGIGRSTIFKQIAAGQLNAKKLGNRTIVLRTDAELWLSGLPNLK